MQILGVNARTISTVGQIQASVHNPFVQAFGHGHPDGILWLNGQMQAVVEAKCRFPFVDNEEHGFHYIGCKQYGKFVLGRQC
jgi:hypothetical protein